MLIIYFDEVKFKAPEQPYEWLAGVAVDDAHVLMIEECVGEIAHRCFSTKVLSRETELHAADIFHRKANFKGWTDIGLRLDVLKDMARVLARRKLIKRICVRIDVGRISQGDDAKQRAFVFFVERANRLAKRTGSTGLLIGDFEKERSAAIFASHLSRYRERGTPYPFGGEIKNLIDTVHFTHSHSSRMLQLADAYVWFMQLYAAPKKDQYPRSELTEFLRQEADFASFPDTYKYWPTEKAWYQHNKQGR